MPARGNRSRDPGATDRTGGAIVHTAYCNRRSDTSSYSAVQEGGAAYRGRARNHVQIVVPDPSPLTEGRNFGVLSPGTWRVSGNATKRALILAGSAGEAYCCVKRSRRGYSSSTAKRCGAPISRIARTHLLALPRERSAQARYRVKVSAQDWQYTKSRAARGREEVTRELVAAGRKSVAIIRRAARERADHHIWRDYTLMCGSIGLSRTNDGSDWDREREMSRTR